MIRLPQIFFLCSLAVAMTLMVFPFAAHADNVLAGNSSRPVWSETTSFEEATLEEAGNAKRGDANALLRLFLLASGDIRDEQSYQQVRNEIDNWLREIEPLISSESDRRQQADRLHRLMHENFFLAGRTEDDVDAGYAYDQSQLSEVFRSKTYNCVSASLLYSVLAHKLGFKTLGVLLPSHAFIELEVSSGNYLEIETTSPSGFGLEHDEAFYRNRQDSDWYQERGLTASTYQDYLDRQRLTPFELGVQNMSNQHASPQRMSYSDRMRMVEFISELSPHDLKAHRIRLGFYSQEYARLQKEADFASLDRMYSKVAPFLQYLEESVSLDLETENLLGWVNSQRALSAIYNHRGTSGIALAKRLLSELNPQIEDYARIKNNLFFALSEYIKAAIAKAKFDDARQIFSGNEVDCLSDTACASLFRQIYSEWAGYHWRLSEWPRVVNRYSEYLIYENGSDTAELFRENLQSAYLNWSNDFVKTQDLPKASEILQKCLQFSLANNRCQTRFDKLQSIQAQ